MNQLIKPNKLSPGDRIAVVTLSWGGPGAFPYRYEVGKQRLESIFGLEVTPTKHALKDPDWIYRNPKARAEDLMEAFLDPSIKGIFSSIGGDDSIRLLPYIDFNIIRQNPKVFLGFSDTTVNHFMCLKAGLSSFYGPAFMTAFAENVKMHAYSIEGIKRVLFASEVIGDIPQNKEGWTKELLDWASPSNQNIRRKLSPPLPWKFTGSSEKPVQGRLIGGCIEVLQFINGTSLWPSLEMWENSILFLETSEEGVGPVALARFLRNLAAQGILEKVNGLLYSKLGGPQITADSFAEYDKAILQVFEEYALPQIPIVTNMDFGHTDPMWTLPYGCLVEIDPANSAVTLLENGVA
jgi:muramoyltetrapeptide carboxypeptidase LdcA involved in peptidoglycan recycling